MELTLLSVFDAESRLIRQSLGLVNALDLNFVLRSEICIHYNRQL